LQGHHRIRRRGMVESNLGQAGQADRGCGPLSQQVTISRCSGTLPTNVRQLFNISNLTNDLEPTAATCCRTAQRASALSVSGCAGELRSSFECPTSPSNILAWWRCSAVEGEQRYGIRRVGVGIGRFRIGLRRESTCLSPAPSERAMAIGVGPLWMASYSGVLSRP